MKIKIDRADDVTIEIEGTPEEVKAILADILPAQPFLISYPKTTGTTLPYTLPYTVPYTFTGICAHEYPYAWFGTVPPKCIKCGA